jgi:hypothetical protein
MDLLPLCLAVAGGQAHFQLFTCIRSVWLHKVDKVPDRHDDIGGQLDEDVVVPVEGDGDICSADGGFSLMQPGLDGKLDGCRELLLMGFSHCSARLRKKGATQLDPQHC